MVYILKLSTKIVGQKNVVSETVCNDEDILREELDNLMIDCKEEIHAAPNDYEYFFIEVLEAERSGKERHLYAVTIKK